MQTSAKEIELHVQLTFCLVLSTYLNGYAICASTSDEKTSTAPVEVRRKVQQHSNGSPVGTCSWHLPEQKTPLRERSSSLWHAIH